MKRQTEVIRTKYDHHIIVMTGDKIHVYEGYSLCPARIQKKIDSGEFREIDSFSFEAISYGYIYQ